ncbi:MAG: hypothetical protein WCD70_09670, partial [Alphaproteobacteria bacterium]
IQVASLQTPAPQQSPILQTPAPPEAVAQTTTALQAPVQTASAAPVPTSSIANLPAANGTASPGIPLDRSKQPYGGVMDTAMMRSAQQNQALALAMAGSSGAMQAQHNLRNSRFATLNTVTPTVAAPVTSAIADTNIPQVAPTPQTQAALQNLLLELQSMKGVSQYQNAAQSTPVPGSAVNVTN